MKTFTWKPFYSELATVVQSWRTRQSDLIAVLHAGRDQGIPMAALQDEGKDGKSFPLKVIEPFTFFSFFNRLGPENRTKLLTIIKEKLKLTSPIPTDYSGVPVTNPQNSWFFSYEKNRESHAIDTLWDFAKEITEKLPADVSSELFDRTLQIRCVGLVQLTMGLFWMRPDHYLALDKHNTAFLEKNGIKPKVKDWPSYLALLKQIEIKYPGTPWTELSKRAYGADESEPSSPETRRYWLYSPGKRAVFWEDCQRDGVMVIGYDDLLDFRKYKSYEEVYDALKTEWEPEENPSNHSLAVWEFANVMQPGDIVIPKKGRSEYLGYGIVEGPYEWNESRTEYKSVRHVKWIKTGSWSSDFSLPLKTLTDITNDSAYVKNLTKLLGIGVDGPLEPPVPSPDNPVRVSGLNTILYGPPGTGKTFDTIERAVRIIEPKFSGNHASHKTRFDELRSKGQIEFITLHQSYSYEDFVEGLRPVTDPEDESSEARYRYCPGVFKRIAVLALFDCLKPTSADAGAVSFDAVWNKLVEQIELDPEKNYPGLTEKTSYRISLTPRGNLEGINIISNKKFLCPRSILEKVYAAKPKERSISSSEVMEIIVRGCHSHFIAAAFNALKNLEKILPATKKGPSITTFSWEQKAEVVQTLLKGRAAGVYTFKPASEWPPYVLVIDEINRGNVSKILGELITLIEPDKRIRAEHSLIVQLPYTQEYFAVPGNLHIIGTMNTADKSIALVDVALRRRFQFEELRPNFEICKGIAPQMRGVLQALNHRICLRKDRDHQIGHSYFIGVSNEVDFNHVFAKHVIPLLQEYFFNDWEGLRFVLGEKNKNGTFIKPLDGCEAAEARTKWQWISDTSSDAALNCLQALAANYQTS